MAKTKKNQAAKLDKVAREIRGLLYDAHNLVGYEIPVAWAETLMDAAILCAQVAKAYRFGRPELPPDLAWFYTTGRDSLFGDEHPPEPF